ncbi:MAG: polyprenyl synthetase family protein [Myxococcales bacterium]|nr:polyprenyl synthetase family protein [Myxococcales bacterium]MDD9967131.1 polyprenyl synthetase family protein [Myxococcales bacterium]
MGSSWISEVATTVSGRLSQFFEEKQAEARELSPHAPELTGAVADLTLRGGKRLRPCAAYAGFLGVCPKGDPERVWDAAAALELLQTYLLIQDDWMDGDEERRGGPSVHAAFAESQGDPVLGASLAILAADLASGFAWELIARAPFPTGRAREGVGAFARMHFEVVCGQQLDLIEYPDVALTHHLKSGSYTVRGPLQLGAILGDGRREQLAALSAVGQPVGVAFQLRDDLLGTFGDPEQTGKPSGNDLRAGKLTSLVAAARVRLSKDEFKPIEAVLGARDADDQAVSRAKELLERSGARQQVEGRLSELLREASDALGAAGLDQAGATRLQELLQWLSIREH